MKTHVFKEMIRNITPSLLLKAHSEQKKDAITIKLNIKFGENAKIDSWHSKGYKVHYEESSLDRKIWNQKFGTILIRMLCPGQMMGEI